MHSQDRPYYRKNYMWFYYMGTLQIPCADAESEGGLVTRCTHGPSQDARG